MHEYEFMGPILGPLGITLGLPLVCYVLGAATGPIDLMVVPSTLMELALQGRMFSWQGLAVVLAWFCILVALHLVIPGQKVMGVVLDDGSRLQYKLNGFRLFMVIYPICLGLGFFTPYLNLSWIHTNWLQVLTGSFILSITLTCYLFLASFHKGAQLSVPGRSPSSFYNFFIGRELNPRLGSLDLKEFCELYPGIIGWAVINLALAHKQWVQFGYVTNSMVMVNVFHLVYAMDGLWNEKSILTTMDITTDGFGFMLAFGDLTWVPFTYALQAKYLADNPVELSILYGSAVVVLNFLGYTIFRGANSQKDQFRRDPDHPSVKHLKTMKTERGRQLIISGWWGMARHINYTGDWLMGLAWCMTTGFDSVVPYFYALYFASLLIHRDLRDEHSCVKKYGKDWAKYCTTVPYRFIPGVY